MTAGVMLFLTMRVLHVVLAAAWFGAAVFTTLLLGPAIGLSGPAGGQVMNALVRRGVPQYMASIGGLTILTGVYLFWRFTGGFDPAISGSRAGIAFSIGALTGLIGLILGGSMIGGSVRKLTALSAQAAGMKEGPDRAALMKTMEALRDRMEKFGKIVMVLLFISMAAMALGHYI
jgi:hypothetical protein